MACPFYDPQGGSLEIIGEVGGVFGRCHNVFTPADYKGRMFDTADLVQSIKLIASLEIIPHDFRLLSEQVLQAPFDDFI